MTHKSHRILTAFVCAVLAAGAASATSDLWLHVRVNEEGGAKVRVNLPVAMLEKAIQMIPDEHISHHGLHFDEHHITPADLRELWQELKDSPDMTFVTVEEDDEHVRVWKESGYLYVTCSDDDDGEVVDVRIPFAVVDALLSGEADELNFQAAVQALVDEGEGELVTVTSDDEEVRVWIDGIAEGE